MEVEVFDFVIDLTAPDFILRKKFQFQDLTICLDQANTTGEIETYQVGKEIYSSNLSNLHAYCFV